MIARSIIWLEIGAVFLSGITVAVRISLIRYEVGAREP
jgi:hypothetical protein